VFQHGEDLYLIQGLPSIFCLKLVNCDLFDDYQAAVCSTLAKEYLAVCVCVRVCARVRVCVFACVNVCVSTSTYARTVCIKGSRVSPLGNGGGETLEKNI